MSEEVQGEVDVSAPQEGDPAAIKADGQEAKQPTQAEIKKFIAQYNGKDVELPMDLEEMLRQHQIMPNARKELTKAQKAQKDVADLIRFAKENPEKFLSHPEIGVDVNQWIMDKIAEQAEEATMSEDQKEARRLKRELEEFKTKAKSAEQEAFERKVAELQPKFEKEIETGIIEGCKAANIFPHPQVVQRIAEYMYQAGNEDYDLKPGDAALLVKEDLLNEMKMLYEKAPDDVVLSMLGDDAVNRIVKAQTSKLKKGTPNATSKVEGEPAQRSDKPRNKQTRDEWLKKMQG